jgi:ankyrin repeat protein
MIKAFFNAARDGDLATLQRMLREGTATVNERDVYGRTVLLVTVYCSQFLVAKWLLEHGGSSITERYHNDYGH